VSAKKLLAARQQPGGFLCLPAERDDLRAPQDRSRQFSDFRSWRYAGGAAELGNDHAAADLDNGAIVRSHCTRGCV
jgi:hypothetical protein